jgi:hypothetical protein
MTMQVAIHLNDVEREAFSRWLASTAVAVDLDNPLDGVESSALSGVSRRNVRAELGRGLVVALLVVPLRERVVEIEAVLGTERSGRYLQPDPAAG